MPSEKIKYSIIVDAELLEKIDDFWHNNRYPNRSAATLTLIRRGLEATEKSGSKDEKKGK